VRDGMFDEGIAYARELLSVMNHGAGRLSLACALYGKAAEFVLTRDSASRSPLLREAAGLGFPREVILERLSESRSKLKRLAPTLRNLVR
jgi:hypothetical protein